MICGVTSSWKPGAISGNYGSYTWSPCGQFFAAQTPTSVEVRDTLTLDKCSSLQPTKPIPKDLKPIGHSPSALAYSRDGHFLAGCFGSTATIWDIQTGGVIKEIDCGAVDASPKSLVWSLDGTTVGATFPITVGNWVVVTYNIASVMVSTQKVQSPYEPYLRPRGSSIWMTVISEDKTTINTFEIWPTIAVHPVKSYSIGCNISDDPPPVMHQNKLLFVNSYNKALCIYNIYNQEFMLDGDDPCPANCFSSGGGVLAASNRLEVQIWRLGEKLEHYYPWKKFPLWEALGDIPRGLKFSPTSLSLLISRDGCLEVQPLEGSITHTPENTILSVFSANGTYLVTAIKDKSTIKIINLYTNNSQLIDINFKISQLTLVGNILFMGRSLGDLTAWRLTAEGTVDGSSDIKRVNGSSRLWIKEWMGNDLSFWASGQTGVIRGSTNIVFYDMETGKELKSAVPSIPSYPSPSWKKFYHDSKEIDFSTWPSFSFYDLIDCNGHPSKDNLPAPIPWYQGGWLMYPEGEYQHRLWLPTHWRTKWEEVHWLNDIKVLRLVLASGKAIIKLD